MPLLPVCYLNDRFEPLADARISPLDRGFLFADAVYEVLPVYRNRPFRFREHFDRLDRSLGAIGIRSPRSHAEWLNLLDELIARNGGGDMSSFALAESADLATGANRSELTDAMPSSPAASCMRLARSSSLPGATHSR